MSVRKGDTSPARLPEGCVLQQGQCHSACGWQECALPGGPCILSPFVPLHTHLGVLVLSEFGVFIVQNALEEPVQLPLSWAETAAQQFLFPFHLWQSPSALLPSLPPSSPPAELLPGPASFPAVPSCSQLLFNPRFFLSSLLQCSCPEDSSQTTSSALHLTAPKPLSQCDKCANVWRGSPSMQTLLGSVAIPWHQPQGQTCKGGCSCLAPSVGTTVSSP